MKRLLLALAAATAAAVTYAVVALGTSEEAAPEPTKAVTAPRPAPPRDSGQSIADAVQRAIDPPPEPEALRNLPVVGRVEAEANFDELMLSLEGIADRDERLTRARREELYRNINDAFSGLSATLDPASAQDMQMLEDANIRMKAMMQELGIRVPLRPPRDAP
jgi:hypothetical protein